MISRVADHCFWFGRYLERAEATARVLAVTQNLVLDAELTPPECWRPVLVAFGQEPQFVGQHGQAAAGDGEAVQRHMAFEEDNSASLRCSIAAARDNARSIREVVSLEVWETVNELHLWAAGEHAEREWSENRYGFYRRVRQHVQLALGLTQSTMLHDTPLDFIWLGVMLERMGQTARTLDVHHLAFAEAAASAPAIELGRQVVETALWLSLLRACSGFEPFMKLSQGRVTGEAVVRFLAFEPRFPRSIRHSSYSAYARLCDIRPPESQTLPGGDSLDRLQALLQWVSEKALDPLQMAEVHGMLTFVVDETAGICNGIGRELLGYGPPASPAAPPDRARNAPPDRAHGAPSDGAPRAASPQRQSQSQS
ncbi:MAG TPA: alpha-E domain-containing protein [Candidatus Nanopelagicales bacterium]|nr:alpha-E domain-containing protein [Candidatus Nanopelagicales bacterium]